MAKSPDIVRGGRPFEVGLSERFKGEEISRQEKKLRNKDSTQIISTSYLHIGLSSWSPPNVGASLKFLLSTLKKSWGDSIQHLLVLEVQNQTVFCVFWPAHLKAGEISFWLLSDNFLLFTSFFRKRWKKYLDQLSGGKAPESWSKYTTMTTNLYSGDLNIWPVWYPHVPQLADLRMV